jgi:hypothetical protein
MDSKIKPAIKTVKEKIGAKDISFLFELQPLSHASQLHPSNGRVALLKRMARAVTFSQSISGEERL